MPLPKVTCDSDGTVTAASGRGPDTHPNNESRIGFFGDSIEDALAEPDRFVVERYVFPPGFDFGFGYGLYLD